MVRLVVLYLDRPCRGAGVAGCAHLCGDRRRHLPRYGDGRPHGLANGASDRNPHPDRHADSRRGPRDHNHRFHRDRPADRHEDAHNPAADGHEGTAATDGEAKGYRASAIDRTS